ncbi:aspartic peptidase domain-containing protein [Roridomyces roridus]|uniref:Aspartic peptidase domain-containing protein n=1 Tax=Roridomyces roridus TaxID=1738132 RepID=A0AAD7BTM3_9AGAR|nr:aspartic peptidase domain-containing protein [Roridomyces roridus]
MLPVVLTLCILTICDARILKRSDPAPLQTLRIPVAQDVNQMYTVGVNMSSSAPQSFAFALTTSTAVTTVAGSSCDSCGGVPSYNPAASSSVQALSQLQNIATLDGSASGSIMREDCGLLQSNGSAWAYPNQTVTVANQSAAFFTPGMSGMIGMGLAPFADSPAANWLARNPTQPTFSFGMALNPPSNSSTDGGVFHWLQPDQSAYTGEVQWKTMLAANASTPSNMTSWFVEMDAWSVTGPSSSPFNITQSGVELLTFLDPLYPSIVFPQGAARSIYANIANASKHSTSAFSHGWKLPCDAKFTLTVTFGTFSTSLDQSSLAVKQADGVCVGVIQEWIDQAATEYLLGSPFIAVLYLIFSYSQSGSGAMGVAARTSPRNKLSAGAIAGIVLGSIAVVALLTIAGVLVYFVFFQRRRSNSKSKPKRPRKHRTLEITPFESDISVSVVDHDARSSMHAPLASPFLGLLDRNGAPNNLTPSSPEWRTTLLTPDSSAGTFPDGNGTSFNISRSSHQYYQTDAGSLIDLDSPPPYPIPKPGSSPPALAPVRKNRALLGR